MQEEDDPLHSALLSQGEGEDLDDPLARIKLPAPTPPPPPAPSLVQSPTFHSLIRNALANAPAPAPASTGMNLGLRARLAAIQQDLQRQAGGNEEEEEAYHRATTRKQLANAKTRRWVMDQLQRDIWLFWERGDGHRALRSACLLAGALGGEVEHSLSEWYLVTCALEQFSIALRADLEKRTLPSARELKTAWFHQLAHLRGLVPRLYMQALLWDLLSEQGEENFLAQSRGITNAQRRLFFLAFLFKHRAAAASAAQAANEEGLMEVLQFAGNRFELTLPLCLILVASRKEKEDRDALALQLSKCAQSAVAINAVLLTTNPLAVVLNARLLLEAINQANAFQCKLVHSLTDQLLLSYTAAVEGKDTVTMDEACMLACAQLLEEEGDADVDAVPACAKLLHYCALGKAAAATTLHILNLLSKLVLLHGSGTSSALALEQALGALVDNTSTSLLATDAYFRIFSALRHTKKQTSLCRRILLHAFADGEHIELLPLAKECAKQCVHDDSLLTAFLHTCITRLAMLGHAAKFELLVDLRGSFGASSQRALKLLIMAACWLAVEVHASSGNADLLCACIGYCHATAPSLLDVAERALCFAHVAMVAASVSRLKQSDALFKAAIQCLAALGKEQPSLRRRLEVTRTIASTLVVAPGHPHAFYLVQGFANAVFQQEHENGEALLAILDLVEAITRINLPYHIAAGRGIDSNDVLYGDADLANEAVALAKQVRQDITSHHIHLLPACSAKLKRIQANLQARKDLINQTKE